MTPEERTAVLEQEWTDRQAQEAFENLEALRDTGVWPNGAPVWARQAAEAIGCSAGSTNIQLIGYERCARAFAEALRSHPSDRYLLNEAEREAVHEGLVFLEERDFPEAAKILRAILNRSSSTFRPDWASPPGHTIADIMKDRGLDTADLCRMTGLHPAAVPLLLDGQLCINERLASRLAEGLGTTTAFWLNREGNYRVALTRIDASYVPQGLAAECLTMLGEALDGPPKGQPNTLLAMTREVCQRVRQARSQLKIGVAALLWRDGQVLMHQRKGSHGAGTWSFPGGHLDPGETPKNTIRREVQEETGLIVPEDQFGPRTFTTDVFEVEGKRYITLYLEANCPASFGEPRVMEPTKCVEWRWVTPGEWPGELFLPIKNLLRDHPELLARQGAAPKPAPTTSSEFPRRICVDRMTPAELAIRDAMGAVEEAGCDVRLTYAVVLLGEAQERVADFVDGVRPLEMIPEDEGVVRLRTLLTEVTNRYKPQVWGSDGERNLWEAIERETSR